MTDQQIFEKFKHYGRIVLSARNKCIGLLPEIYKREIFRKHGCGSIYEFAAKYAGLSQEQVNRVLNLEKRLQDRPILQAALVRGAVSVNKLRKVLTIATVENQGEILETVKNLSVRAVETMVRDYRQNESKASVNGDKVAGQDGHVTTQSEIFREELQLSDGVRDELLEMQKKGIDVNALLAKFLQAQREELEREKEEIAGQATDVKAGREDGKSSRYVPVRVKNVLQQEFGERCAVPGCGRVAVEIHHLLPYAIAGRHDPRFMVKLCGEHHRIAHAVNAKVLDHRWW